MTNEENDIRSSAKSVAHELASRLFAAKVESNIQMIGRRVRVSRIIDNLNRDYANNEGIVKDYPPTHDLKLEMRLFNHKQRKVVPVLIRTNVNGPRVAGTWSEGDYSVYITGTTESSHRWGSKIIVNPDSKNLELRKIERKLNREARRGLRKNGFRVTTMTRLRQIGRITRDAGAIIGGAYATSAVLYRAAESLIGLPKLPIFP